MIRVLLADSRADSREALRAALAADPDMEVAGQARDGEEALQMAHALRPDVVLLRSDLAGRDGFVTAELLAASGLPLGSILLSPDDGRNDGPDDLRRAMRAGARACLTWPGEAYALAETVRLVFEDGRRREGAAFAAQADPRRAARVVAVCGAKGGIGKTTLAVNLAAALATQTGEPTALLDLYTQFADVALLLNLAPRRTLADLTRLDPDDLDERLLEDHLERHECGLRVLAGASVPLALDALSAEHLDQILGLLKRGHRFVVLDVPPVLHAGTLHALSHASDVLLLANLFDLTTLADTRLWLDAMAGKHVARESVQIVLNRVSPRNRLQLPDIERTLGARANFLIPNDALVPASVNGGVPFVLSHPHSRVAQSVTQMACALSAGGRAVPAPRRLPFWRSGGAAR